ASCPTKMTGGSDFSRTGPPRARAGGSSSPRAHRSTRSANSRAWASPLDTASSIDCAVLAGPGGSGHGGGGPGRARPLKVPRGLFYVVPGHIFPRGIHHGPVVKLVEICHLELAALDIFEHEAYATRATTINDPQHAHQCQTAFHVGVSWGLLRKERVRPIT